MVVKWICGASLGLGILSGSVGGFLLCVVVGLPLATHAAVNQVTNSFSSEGSSEVEPMVAVAVAREEGLL